jgi:spore germination protein YaaH
VLATPAVDWSGAWDYSELSARSDGLFIMGYGYHWTGGNPGPNDPLHGGGAWSKWALDWTVEDYLEHDADPDKVILGLPLYGQQWEATGEVPGTATGDAWSVTMEEAIPLGERYGAQYDAPTASPYAIGDGTQLWYPTHDSVMERIEFALDAGLAGVGFWALDYEGRDPAFWDRVEVVVADADPGEGADSGGDADGDGDADRDSGVDRGSGVARRIEGEDGGCGCGGRTGGSWIAILLVAARGSLRRR